ncbi:MAG: hypothetical protein F9K19_26585, partial [Rhizobiaceae bacterium]
RTPDERTTQTASQAPAPGGEIISESGGAIKSEQRGGFVGIGIDPKRPRYPISAERIPDRRGFKFAAEQVAMILHTQSKP